MPPHIPIKIIVEKRELLTPIPLQHLMLQAKKVPRSTSSSHLKGHKMINHPFKILFWSLLAISASCNECVQELPPCSFSRPLLEVKAGYFFFSNSKIRKIYDKGGLDIQLCASYPFWNLTSRWALNAYGAVEYLQRSG